jgi:hypothetical protein
MKFAKLFDLEDGEQVLVTVDYNDNEDRYELVFRTDFDGVVAQMSLGFKDEEKAVKALEKCELKRAVDFRAIITKHFVSESEK